MCASDTDSSAPPPPAPALAPSVLAPRPRPPRDRDGLPGTPPAALPPPPAPLLPLPTLTVMLTGPAAPAMPCTPGIGIGIACGSTPGAEAARGDATPDCCIGIGDGPPTMPMPIPMPPLLAMKLSSTLGRDPMPTPRGLPGVCIGPGAERPRAPVGVVARPSPPPPPPLATPAARVRAGEAYGLTGRVPPEAKAEGVVGDAGRSPGRGERRRGELRRPAALARVSVPAASPPLPPPPTCCRSRGGEVSAPEPASACGSAGGTARMCGRGEAGVAAGLAGRGDACLVSVLCGGRIVGVVDSDEAPRPPAVGDATSSAAELRRAAAASASLDRPGEAPCCCWCCCGLP